MSWLKRALFGTKVGDKALAALERTGLAVVELEELELDARYGATAKGRAAIREGRRGNTRKDA